MKPVVKQIDAVKGHIYYMIKILKDIYKGHKLYTYTHTYPHLST
jgi:hypothetical protein